jgi:hypothetical protein
VGGRVLGCETSPHSRDSTRLGLRCLRKSPCGLVTASRRPQPQLRRDQRHPPRRSRRIGEPHKRAPRLNNLSGPIPTSLLSIKGIHFLDLSCNNLTSKLLNVSVAVRNKATSVLQKCIKERGCSFFFVSPPFSDVKCIAYCIVLLETKYPMHST